MSENKPEPRSWEIFSEAIRACGVGDRERVRTLLVNPNLTLEHMEYFLHRRTTAQGLCGTDAVWYNPALTLHIISSPILAADAITAWTGSYGNLMPDSPAWLAAFCREWARGNIHKREKLLEHCSMPLDMYSRMLAAKAKMVIHVAAYRRCDTTPTHAADALIQTLCRRFVEQRITPERFYDDHAFKPRRHPVAETLHLLRHSRNNMVGTWCAMRAAPSLIAKVSGFFSAENIFGPDHPITKELASP